MASFAETIAQVRGGIPQGPEPWNTFIDILTRAHQQEIALVAQSSPVQLQQQARRTSDRPKEAIPSEYAGRIRIGFKTCAVKMEVCISSGGFVEAQEAMERAAQTKDVLEEAGIVGKASSVHWPNDYRECSSFL